jgi:hypothetical protein
MHRTERLRHSLSRTMAYFGGCCGNTCVKLPDAAAPARRSSGNCGYAVHRTTTSHLPLASHAWRATTASGLSTTRLAQHRDNNVGRVWPTSNLRQPTTLAQDKVLAHNGSQPSRDHFPDCQTRSGRGPTSRRSIWRKPRRNAGESGAREKSPRSGAVNFGSATSELASRPFCFHSSNERVVSRGGFPLASQ